jgi:hypothetical protein
MDETPRSRWALAADLLFLLILSFTIDVLVTGGFVARFLRVRVSVTSATRLLLIAVVVLVVRWIVCPHPTLLDRLRALRRDRRVALAWVGVIAVLCGLNLAARMVEDERETSTRTLALRRPLLFAELQPSRLLNCRFERIGEPNDGGYLLCGNLLGSSQVAYSYGLAGNDKWGCDVSQRLGVTVHEYDCFDPREPPCPSAARQAFHAECIAGSRRVEDGRLFDSLQDQMARNGDRARHAVVKMDVEGAEWESLLDSPDEALERIDQIVIEFHGVDERLALPAVRRLKRFFYVANMHVNNMACTTGLLPFPGRAYEVLFVNKRIAKVDRPGWFLPWLEPAKSDRWSHPPDARNDPLLPDCQVR